MLTQSELLLLQHVMRRRMMMDDLCYVYDISGEFRNAHPSITNDHVFLSVAWSNISNARIICRISNDSAWQNYV